MTKRDHGGSIDAAIAQYGGTRAGWLDLSTGINPVPYPVGAFAQDAWTALPDTGAFDALEQAARNFWTVPPEAAVLAAPGASALIARLPMVRPAGAVEIQAPTYNEHAAAFEAAGWHLRNDSGAVRVAVHPNNPDGRLWQASELEKGTPALTIIDESFCDIAPKASHINRTSDGKTVVLKSFGKFWGLAGLRLGFAIGAPALIDPLRSALGPWQVSGPALSVGTKALQDFGWADETRQSLTKDAARLDEVMARTGASIVGGIPLFRLYHVADAAALQRHLAQHHVWSRIFPYSHNWIRLGLPAPDRWAQLEAAL